MNHFVGLPWRIASLAGLLVGAISLLTGAGPWTSLIRVSVAFVVFGAAGFGLSFLLQHGDAAPPAPGHHFDQTVADQPKPEDSSDNTPGS
jgi:hypothetical protein